MQLDNVTETATIPVLPMQVEGGAVVGDQEGIRKQDQSGCSSETFGLINLFNYIYGLKSVWVSFIYRLRVLAV